MIDSDAFEQDQQTIAQKDELDKEIAATTPLVGRAVDEMSVLQEEFKSDALFLGKVNHLTEKYAGIRRTRPDGNCFFRSVGFRYFELIQGNKEEVDKFREVVRPSKDKMIKLGFPQFTVEDFYDTFMGTIDKLEDKSFDLVELFNDQGNSDYVVVFLRLLTSMHLQENADFYQSFIESGVTVKEFCATDVEPMYQESDNIHVTALTAVTKINVRIMYLDRGDHAEASAHDSPEGKTPHIHLLYRPGHYEILYPRT